MYVRQKLCFFRCNAIELIKVQTAIFEVKSNIEKLIPKLPVNSLIAKRLIDIDDTEIINCLYLIS